MFLWVGGGNRTLIKQCHFFTNNNVSLLFKGSFFCLPFSFWVKSKCQWVLFIYFPFPLGTCQCLAAILILLDAAAVGFLCLFHFISCSDAPFNLRQSLVCKIFAFTKSWHCLVLRLLRKLLFWFSWKVYFSNKCARARGYLICFFFFSLFSDFVISSLVVIRLHETFV